MSNTEADRWMVVEYGYEDGVAGKPDTTFLDPGEETRRYYLDGYRSGFAERVAVRSGGGDSVAYVEVMMRDPRYGATLEDRRIFEPGIFRAVLGAEVDPEAAYVHTTEVHPIFTHRPEPDDAGWSGGSQ